MMMERIRPVFNGNYTAIVFAANDEFVSYMAVMIQSIIEHASDENKYDIVILHGAISEDNQQKIVSLSLNYKNVSIRFADVDPLFESLDLYTGIRGMRLTKETYYRMAVGQVLADEYTRVIYLDGDMVMMTDVAELYTVELEGYYLAAPYDISGIGYCHKPGNDRIDWRKNSLKLKNPDTYFICGLLVINLPMLRKDYPVESLLKMAASREWMQHDQDVLNVICNNGKACLLHPSWNVLADFGNNRYLPPELRTMWLESEQKPLVIHYGGNKKPWNLNVIREEPFWSTAARTPFWDTIVQNMLRKAQQYNEDEWPVAEEHIESVRKKVLNGRVEPKRNDILAELARMDARTEPFSSDPLVSVIVPVYNEEKRLERCLNSIINQTYHNLEIIVVDDGSTDNSASICDRYEEMDQRIRVIHKKNGGVASARNAGLKEATGDYIGWVDADDWISCDMYEYLINGAKKYRTPVVVCGHITVDDDGAFQDCKFPNHSFKDNTLMLGEALIQLINRNIRNYLYDRIWERGLFNDIVFAEGANFEDLRVVYQLFIKSRWITWLCMPKYYRCIHEGSIVMTFTIKNRLESVQGHLERYSALVSNWPSLKPILLNQIGIAIIDLSRAIKNDSKNNYIAYKSDIDKSSDLLRKNIEFADIQGWDLRAIRCMMAGNRFGWLKGNLIIRIKEKKQRFDILSENITEKINCTRSSIIDLIKKVKNKLKKVLKNGDSVVTVKSEETKALERELELYIQNAAKDESPEETKKRFFMAIPKAEGDVALLQRGNLYLLRRLKGICEAHDIRYWLIGGTLIGAVRHKGAIPWDDDVDVAILREDLEKLLTVIDQYPELKIDRYYHSNGAWQTMKMTFIDEDMPFWIDLLLYDYAGNRSMSAEVLWEKIQTVRKETMSKLRAANIRMNMKYSDMIIYDEKDAEAVDTIYSNAFAKLPAVMSRDYVYRSIDSVCVRWKTLFACDITFPLGELEYEGDMYPVPKDYGWYLNFQYGDIYSIPNDIGHMHNRFIGDKLEKKTEIIEKLSRYEAQYQKTRGA